IVPSADFSVYVIDQYVDLYNEPLYWYPTGATVAIDQPLSLADPPVYSDGNRTVTVQIKPWKWSNGQPVTAADVVFFIDELKAAIKESTTNWGSYVQGNMPDNVVSATASGQTLVLHLTRAFNPGFFTDNQLSVLNAFPPAWAIDRAGGPLLDYANPNDAKLIYNYLAKEGGDIPTFGTNPLWHISDGPLIPQTFNATTGGYTMVPNPDYSGPQKARFSKLNVLVYTSTQAMFDNMIAGALDMGTVDSSDLPSVHEIATRYHVFGLPAYGFQNDFFNFADKTNDFDHVIAQLYVRQALAHLVDQQGYIRGILKGAGSVDYSTIPPIPTSPYVPPGAYKNPYPYSISAAAALLTSHGWKVVPNGQTTCVDPSKCGPGIPAGTKLELNLQFANSPASMDQESVAFASAAKQVGITVSLQSMTFNQLISNDNDPTSKSYINRWAIEDFGGYTNNLYPTTNGILNTGGPLNQGFYSNAEANALIHASVYGNNPKAVENEATFLGQNLPGLFFPNPDNIIAVKDTIGGTTASMLAQTQYVWTPQYWYITKH
ncbi:MAG: ABC transporter substrate-binding protein, partial [Acidimicrobiales bacterium]